LKIPEGAIMGNGISSPIFKDIIVAVHGIGQQARYSTVRSVATRLAASKTLFAGGKDRPVAPQPLGYFHSEVKGITSVSLLDDAAILATTALASTGFAEVFWADIPQQVVKEGSTLEETKAWARTVVARAQALWMHAGRPGTVTPDFGLAAEVLDEIIETVYVLENLLFLADKVRLFKFDLRRVLKITWVTCRSSLSSPITAAISWFAFTRRWRISTRNSARTGTSMSGSTSWRTARAQ